MNGKICLTFDYELFFGRTSGTVENCILKPTTILLDLFEETGMKATFFVDVMFLMKLLEQRLLSDIGRIKEQLQRIISLGSRIELHLHPHWLDAMYAEPYWEFHTYKRYCLDALDGIQIENLFIAGTGILNEIAREVDGAYCCVAFRAGGFALPPFFRLADAFRKSGIFIDSSIADGLMVEHEDYRVEYPIIGKSCYRFTKNPLEEEADGEFVEVPISTRRISILEKCVRRIVHPYDEPKAFGDGEGMLYKNIWHRRLRSSNNLITLDRGGRIENIKGIFTDVRLYTIISHPKSMNSVSVEYLRRLGDSDLEFLTIEEVGKNGC